MSSNGTRFLTLGIVMTVSVLFGFVASSFALWGGAIGLVIVVGSVIGFPVSALLPRSALGYAHGPPGQLAH